MKKEKKILWEKLKDYDYFTPDDADRVKMMQEVEKLEELLSLTR